jgi:signal transduction histidine kinase
LADTGAQQTTDALVRLVLNLRIVAVLLTVLWTPYSNGSLHLVSVALVVAAVLTLIPLLAWDRVGPSLMRHPSYLAFDLLMAVGILSVTGPDSPFLYFALGTAVLSGVLYRMPGAALFSVLLILGHLGVLLLRTPTADQVLTFQSLVGLPALYPISAAAGAAIRRLLDRQRAVEEALTERSRAAIMADERARLAREMHDSLAKTVHGIALSAAALPAWVERSPEQASASARNLAAAAERAAAEARELIGDLRSDRLDQPLQVAARLHVQEWSAAHGVVADLAIADVGTVAPEARYELFCILKEALRNVERHARASRVLVAIHRDGDDVVLSVADDGQGLAVDVTDLSQLAAEGHYGLVGMTERARRAGGRLDLTRSDWGGLRVSVVVHAAGQPPPPGTRTGTGTRTDTWTDATDATDATDDHSLDVQP